MRALFRQFSFPGGIPSHVAPETPGSIHEGGELGYALVHAFGAVFDNPDLLALCVVGDGEAETGPLAASWHSNKFLNPVTDGAVLPVLHLNGYKIANPTVLARIPEAELAELMRGYGYEPHFVSGDDPAAVHRAVGRHAGRGAGRHRRASSTRPATARHDRPAGLADDRAAHPEGLDRAEGGRRAAGRGHLARAPGAAGRDADQPRAPRPARGVDAQLPAGGAVRRDRPADRRNCRRSHPSGDRRMSANPHANGGLLLRDLAMPDFRDYAVAGRAPGDRHAARRPGCSARSCATSSPATPTGSG